jgi:hypothetical protein
LFPDRVFGEKTVLYVLFKELLISNAALNEIPALVPIQVLRSFGRNEVETRLFLVGDGSLKPVLFNPENDLRLPNMKRARQAFYGKEITAYITQAGAISPEHVADRFGRRVDLLRHLDIWAHPPQKQQSYSKFRRWLSRHVGVWIDGTSVQWE